MTTVTNWGVAIVASLIAAFSLVIAFIPKLIGCIVILLVGWLVASILARGVTYLLRRTGFDRLSNRIGLTRLERRMNIRMDPPHLLGRIVFWFVFLIFLVPAVDALGLTTISTLLDTIISYIPNVFVALLVLVLGAVIASLAADLIYRATVASGRVRSPRILANIVRYAIIAFAVLVALYQLQIAPAMIQTLFTAVVGALALGFALAFGLGGRDTAKRYLERTEAAVGGGAGPQAALSQAEGGVNYMPGTPPGTYPEQVRTEPGPFKRPISERPMSDRPMSDRPMSERPMGERSMGERPMSDRPIDR